MDLNNLILIFIVISFGYFFYIFFIPNLKKSYPKLLIDDQLNKPQAFHDTPISISGGISLFLSFLIIFFYFLFFKNISFLQYLSFCTLIFLIGFADDLKIKINANARLMLMIIFLTILVVQNNFYIESTGIEFLNNWLSNSKFFSIIFVCLCFLFIVNGANLVDGYNGLLGFHSLIILTNLLLVNYLNENSNLAYFLLFQIIALIVFLNFNFPKAKVFLGDGGSYFLGTLVSVSVIETSIANPTISPFYFCILLFYLFFEVFFSFFRKLIKEKKSPLQPDKKHLHMLLYKIMFQKNGSKLKSNYYVSLIINLIYLILTFPAIFMMKDGMFCKYYSLIFFVIYIFSYKIASGKVKQNK